MKYDLECRYDSRNSFYGKAQVVEKEGERELYSYGTLVAKVISNWNKTIYEYYGKYSQTTTRHQKDFFKQHGLNDKQIEEVFKKGILEV